MPATGRVRPDAPPSPRSARSHPSGPRPVARRGRRRLHGCTGSKADRPGRVPSPTCSWCRPRRRPASASSSSSPATPGVTVTAQQFSATATPWPGSTSTASPLAADRAGRHPPTAPRTGELRHLLLLAGVAPSSSAISEGALALTAAYAKTREQFGRPIGTFQAVSQRLADGYIDTLRPAAHAVAGRLAARARGCRPTPRSRSRSCGRPTPATGSRTRRCTCTAGSASTSTARRTATSPRAKRYEFPYGGATEQALHIGADARRRAGLSPTWPRNVVAAAPRARGGRQARA